VTQRIYNVISGVVFLAIAILHLLRLIFGWEATVAGRPAPAWLSVVAVVISGYLGHEGLRMLKKR
jgi:hypothetical protein